MKAKLSILSFLAVALFNCSFAKGPLTKENAKKQIDLFTSQQLYASFFLKKFIPNYNLPENINALKKSGFIDLIKTGKGMLEIKVLKKGLSYLIKEEHNELHFNVGSVPTEIISIAEPVNENGELVCYVAYKEKIIHSAFFKAWNPHCFKEGVTVQKVKFVKKEEEWALQQEG